MKNSQMLISHVLVAMGIENRYSTGTNFKHQNIKQKITISNEKLDMKMAQKIAHCYYTGGYYQTPGFHEYIFDHFYTRTT